jgi:hypothetical protein
VAHLQFERPRLMLMLLQRQAWSWSKLVSSLGWRKLIKFVIIN